MASVRENDVISTYHVNISSDVINLKRSTFVSVSAFSVSSLKVCHIITHFINSNL